jgi:hypothetical protein
MSILLSSGIQRTKIKKLGILTWYSTTRMYV